MVQQIQSMCGDCGGTGEFIREKDRCKKCKGKRTVEIDEKLEVGFNWSSRWAFIRACPSVFR